MYKTTDDMKRKLGIKKNSPLADALPEVTISAKEFATSITTENTRRKNLQGKGSILNEHVTNNSGVREVLVKAGIYPESLPPEENIKKLIARHKKERKELEKRQQQEMREAKIRLK